MATKRKNTKSCSFNRAWMALGVTRILLGFIFLWAFFDKLLGWGKATPAGKAWVDGILPTTGYLKGVEKAGGPFADFFGSFANSSLFAWLFMLGLLFIGVALILGVSLRLAALFGIVMMIMMWMSALPLKTNPIIDDHIIYAALLWVIAFGKTCLSINDWWRSLDVVKNNAWLR